MDSQEEYRSTDMGNAEWLAKLYGERIRYDHLRGRWLLWHEHFWKEDENGAIYRLAVKSVRKLYDQVKTVEDLDRAKVSKMGYLQ